MAFQTETKSISPQVKYQCQGCKNILGLKAKKCTGCKSVRYCNVSCQKADWKNHKIICKTFNKSRRERIKNIGSKTVWKKTIKANREKAVFLLNSIEDKSTFDFILESCPKIKVLKLDFINGKSVLNFEDRGSLMMSTSNCRIYENGNHLATFYIK
jgi:hypothetical protein